MFTYKKYISARRPVPHLGTKIGSPAYQKKVYKYIHHQGASIAPPAAPPSGGGGGPPPPAPGGGGGTSCRTLLPRRQASTSHRGEHSCSSHYPRHGGGNPMHCSRNPSSWIRIHMPSGTSCNTVSRRRRISSKSTPAAAGGACDGPAPGSSNRRLLAGLSGSAGPPAASSRRRLSSTWRSLWLSLNRRSIQLHLAPARCQICTCTKQQTTDHISIYTSYI
jgi:hypothetical protein